MFVCNKHKVSSNTVCIVYIYWKRIDCIQLQEQQSFCYLAGDWSFASSFYHLFPSHAIVHIMLLFVCPPCSYSYLANFICLDFIVGCVFFSLFWFGNLHMFSKQLFRIMKEWRRIKMPNANANWKVSKINPSFNLFTSISQKFSINNLAVLQ